jgi:hypothetical protein
VSAPEILSPEALLARIRQDGVRRTAQALRKPPLPSSLLQSLADLEPAEAPEARAFVAAYPLTPSHLLETLAAQSPTTAVLALLAANPRTPPHLLLEFAAHSDAGVRAQAALHPQLPARELLDLADDPDAGVRRALATNPGLRLPQQALLVCDRDPAVRVALAGLSVLAGPAALVLAIDDSAVVRLHTVANAPADDETICGWAASDEEDVQLALLQRRSLPKNAEHLLLDSVHSVVRRRVRERFQPDAMDLLALVTTGEAEERRWVAARRALPRPLQRLLAEASDASVRTALAGNPQLDPDIATYFIDLADEPVCVALAGNPVLSEEQVQAIAATRYPAVLAALAYRENLEPSLARLLVNCSPDFRRHWAIQDRPLSGLDAQTARTLLADLLPAVRRLAVRGHAWRRADLYDLVRDPVASVRIAVVEHPHAPDELIADALADADPTVAARARAVQGARRQQPKPASEPAASITASPPATKPEAALAIPVIPALPATAVAGNLLNKLARLFR